MTHARILEELKRKVSLSLSLDDYRSAFGFGADGMFELHTFVKAHDLFYRWTGETIKISKRIKDTAEAGPIVHWMRPMSPP